MAIYAIGDLHLSFNQNKPMDIFGSNWKNHEKKIKEDWEKKVTNNDLVLLPGDFSWSMYLDETIEDFNFLNKLPGKKILLKGNHDYWWTTITSMRKFLKENNIQNVDFLYNNSYEFENCIIAGTRGWNLTDEEDDKKLIKRELARLELSIKDGINKYGIEKEILVCMHYPPVSKAMLLSNSKKEFIEVMKKYNVKECIYGHLHGKSIYEAVEEAVDGIELKLVSADKLDFKLARIR